MLLPFSAARSLTHIPRSHEGVTCSLADPALAEKERLGVLRVIFVSHRWLRTGARACTVALRSLP